MDDAWTMKSIVKKIVGLVGCPAPLSFAAWLADERYSDVHK